MRLSFSRRDFTDRFGLLTWNYSSREFRLGFSPMFLVSSLRPALIDPHQVSAFADTLFKFVVHKFVLLTEQRMQIS